MRRLSLFIVPFVALASSAFAQDAENPFLGRWALTIPGNAAGWLGIEDKGDYLDGSILWGGGSVVPLESVAVINDGRSLHVTRIQEIERKNSDGEVVAKHRFTEVIMGELDGPDALKLTQTKVDTDGYGMIIREFRGVRIPPMPDAPNLKRVKFGDPIQIFNGKDLTGWEPTNPSAKNGWTVKDGILTNDAPRSGANFANLRTTQEFEDFNLSLEVRVPAGGNSGVYLRGIYEVQVEDSHGKPADSHHMGAVYSRITPSATVEKPAGEWQTMDITLVDRHVTVVLNGTTIIDNQPLLGCTGGALWSDEFRPGPIYLQGDHGAIEYRNMVLRPVRN